MVLSPVVSGHPGLLLSFQTISWYLFLDTMSRDQSCWPLPLKAKSIHGL